MWFLHRIYDLLLRVWFYIFDRVLLYYVMRHLSRKYDIQFMNLGYWPTEASMKRDRMMREVVEKHSTDKDANRPHYYLYERALMFHPDYPGLKDLRVLEVGCGQGYGMEWMKKAHPNIELTNGIDRCAHLETHVIPGDAENLPFDDHQFDVVLNVESSHLYNDCEQFFRECSRVLKKGGYLCWIDLRYHYQIAETRMQAVNVGLIEERWDEVTDNVLLGINYTSARYDYILNRVPWFVRLFSSSFRATYCAPGTHTYARFARKEKGYYAALWINK